MAGTRGPIAERSEDVIRRNERDPITKIQAYGRVEPPELDLGVPLHPLIVDLYESIKESAQARYYEPTDWQYARITLYALNEELLAAQSAGKPVGAMKLTALNAMMTALLLTEGDRRRVRIEIERSPVAPADNVVDARAAFQSWLEAP